MPRSTCLATASLLSTALITLTTATLPSPAHAAPGRQSMEQCVDRVLARLARARADEAQVGLTVVSQCDGPLRAALAEGHSERRGSSVHGRELHGYGLKS